MPKLNLLLFIGIFWSVELNAQIVPFGVWKKRTPCVSLDSSWTPSWASITGYWGLDGAVGAIANGATVSATVGGDGTASTGGTGFDYVSTKVEQGLHISTNSGVNLGHQPALKTGLPLSISLWVKFDSVGVVQYMFRNDEYSGTSRFCGAALSINAAGNLFLQYGDCEGASLMSDRHSFKGATALSAGVWYHLVGVIQGNSDMQLYVNGAVESGTYSGNGGTIAYSADGLGGIGYDALDATKYTQGIVDEVALWDAALSQTDAATIYNNQICH